ncbi:MAG: PAS domain S-box protein [Bacteroidales bacterium]
MENSKSGTRYSFGLFDFALEGVAVFNQQGNLCYHNEVARELLNIKIADQNFSEIFPNQVYSQIIKNSSGRKAYSIQLLASNGQDFKISSKFDTDAGILVCYILGNEQNKYLLNKDDIESLNLINLVEEAADCFFVLDNDLRFINVNNSACKLTGYSKEELFGMEFKQLFSKQELENKPFDRVGIEEGKIIIFERKILRKDGTEIDTEMRTKKLSDGNIFSTVRDITSRVQIRTQLQNKNMELEEAYQQVIKSEKRYKQLFRNLPLGIFTATENGTIESINFQMLEILGSDSAQKSMQFNLFELPTLKNTKLLQDFKSALYEGRSHYKLYEYTSVWGKKTYLKSHILPLEKEDVARILVIVEDYTKERENEFRMRILSQGVNNSPASIVVTNNEGKIIFVNKRFVELTGYSMEELINHSPSILKSGYHSNEFYKHLWETIMSGKEWVGEFLNKKKNGELYWESGMISALKDENGKITNFMAIKEDITRKKQVEKELMMKTEQLFTLINHTPDNICFKDENGRWILANTAALKLFGLENVAYQGKTNAGLLSLSSRESLFLNNDAKTDQLVWEKGDVYQYEANFTDESGNKVVLEVVKLPLHNDDGTRKGIINIGRDITRRKTYEQELMIAKEKAEESDLLKSAFLANMSHEIRTPLNAIMGFTSLLADYSLDKDSISKFLDIIQVNGKQLLTIIDDILLVSKLQVHQIKVSTAVFELDQVLTRLYQQYSRELSILSEKQIELSIEKININSVIRIKTDRDKLSQIYSKLIRNAIKFTSKGKIQFGVELKPDNELVFFVKDTGVGISEEKQEVIFKKFRQADDSTTREYGGTGLGLSIVKGLIDLLKGNLWVESKQGKGSAFYFKLPLESKEIVDTDIKTDKKRTRWENKKILIVDDVAESIFLLSEVLKSTGVKIFSAESGTQAIKRFTENQDIDLILMDIQLPEINGLEAASQIKKINPRVAIIIQTAYGQDSYTQKSREAGCDDIIFKPINFEILFQKMNRFLSPD